MFYDIYKDKLFSILVLIGIVQKEFISDLEKAAVKANQEITFGSIAKLLCCMIILNRFLLTS